MDMTSTPTQLATVTDLPVEGVQAVMEALNSLVADAFALYVKTKTFHWHLFGPHFRDYHLLFDEQAEQILGTIDALAERVRKIGGTTIRGIAHIAELQTIQDDNQALAPEHEMLQRLCDDNAHLVKRQRAAHAVCNQYGDVATASLLEIMIDETERRTWFLFEALLAAPDA
jgi:starvation-inducible DNA-binding protein